MKSIAACEYRVSARARFRSKNCAPNASKGFLSEIQDPGTGVGTTTRYQRDAVGRITATTHCPVTPASLPAGLALSAITGPDSASTLQQQRNFNADTQSNRLLGHTTTDTTDGATTSNTSYTYQYNAAGQLTNTGATGLALAYDTAGRLGQLAPAAAPAQATRYQHNLLGQRVRKIDASQNTITLYGEAEQGMESMALGLYNSTTGTGATEVIYLPTASGPMPIATLVKGVKYAIHSDHLNTPRRLIQSDGKAAWQWVTSAFGEVPPTTGKTRFVSPKVNPATTGTTTLASFDLRYPGQVEDTESGLFYNHNRFYDPVTGRYLQSDPIGLNRGWNRFGYVEGNPLSMIDQTGLAGIMPSGRFWEPTVIDSGSSCGPMLPQSRVDDSGCISTGGGQSICFGPGAIGSVATNLAEQMAMQAARDGLHNSRSSTS